MFDIINKIHFLELLDTNSILLFVSMKKACQIRRIEANVFVKHSDK